VSDLLDFWLESLPLLLDGLVVSLNVTGMALGIGIPLGLFLALGVQSKARLANLVSLAVVEIGRGAPALVVLQFAYFGLPATGLTLSSFAAAVFALAWNTGAYTSEIIRSGLESVPYGEIEAASAMGMVRRDTLRFVIVPQGLRVAAPALLGFATQMLQASSLCFAIALPELTSKRTCSEHTTFRYMEILSLAGILYGRHLVPATFAVEDLRNGWETPSSRGNLIRATVETAMGNGKCPNFGSCRRRDPRRRVDGSVRRRLQACARIQNRDPRQAHGGGLQLPAVLHDHDR